MKKKLIILFLFCIVVLSFFRIFFALLEYTPIEKDETLILEQIDDDILLKSAKFQGRLRKAKKANLKSENKKIVQKDTLKKIDFYYDEIDKSATRIFCNYIINNFNTENIKDCNDWNINYYTKAFYFDIDSDSDNEIIAKAFDKAFFDDKKGGMHVFILKRFNDSYKDISYLYSYGEIFILKNTIEGFHSIAYYYGFMGYRNKTIIINKNWMIRS